MAKYMQLCIKAKFYQYLLSKRDNYGFTWAEMLVIIIIFGILAAIALPYFMVQTPKAILSEARNYVGAMNRAQQAYFIESNGEFSPDLNTLNISIPEQTQNYRYLTKVTINAAFNYGIAREDYVNSGLFNKKPVKSFVGGIFVIPAANKSEIITLSILCMSDKPGNIIPPQPILNNGVPNCAAGTVFQ